MDGHLNVLPHTRGARFYRKLLTVLWVASITGITLTLNDLAGKLMDVGLEPARLEARMLAFNMVILANWAVICWTSYRGSRRNLAPPQWAYVAVVVGMWAAIILNRLD